MKTTLRIGSVGMVHINNANHGRAIRPFRVVKIEKAKPDKLYSVGTHAEGSFRLRSRGNVLVTATDLDGKHFRFYDTNVVWIQLWN